MLELAFKHKDALKTLLLDVSCHPEKYPYYNTGSWQEFESTIHPNTWVQEEFVSVVDGQVIGLLKAEINRDTEAVKGLTIVHFDGTGYQAVFAADLRAFFQRLAVRYRKIGWTAVSGNPVIPAYTKLAIKLGGRVVGYKEKHSRLWDGSYADLLIFEVMCDKIPERYKVKR